MTSRRCCWSRRLLAAGLALLLSAGAHAESAPAVLAQLGLPALPFPADNPPSAASIALGKKLFFDRRLSFNNTMSCAMCHVPDQGFTSNELRTPLGNEGATVRRNAPTLLNVAYHPRLFHDGRDDALETQAWSPLLAANEMANPSIGHVLDKLRTLPDYTGLFEAAFAGRRPTADTVGQALASYERSLVSGATRFDRYRYGGDAGALDDSEQLGYRLFVDKAGCARCHTIGDEYALLSDFRYHNTGIGWMRSRERGEVLVQFGAGRTAILSAADIARIGAPPPSDLGRFEITLDPADRWAYKTPMLRNVALTAPYMHDGSLPTLEAVVEYYNRGGAGAPAQSPLLTPLQLSAAEKAALVRFLESLTGRH